MLSLWVPATFIRIAPDSRHHRWGRRRDGPTTSSSARCDDWWTRCRWFAVIFGKLSLVRGPLAGFVVLAGALAQSIGVGGVETESELWLVDKK